MANVISGLYSNIPSPAANTGIYYYATDTGVYWLADGDKWIQSTPDLDTSGTPVSYDGGLAVHVVNANTIPVGYPPTQLDAFGRLRISTPYTMFDSSYRYKDNGLWSTLTASNGAATFNANQGLVDLTVDSSSGSSVIRETTKVFSYQPGKSLLVLNTFVMAPKATNLRQRVGYFGANNGYYFQQDDSTVSFVERTSVSGSLVENIITQAQWNGDKLDGTGASGLILDTTKAQIMWMDLEWLGVGTVRVGFVINGKFIVCHSFNHANLIATTYITTASLPLRYEITNKAATSGSSTLKQICSTVSSEGGYELRGLQQSICTPITTAKTLTTAGTYYPAVSIRLKSTFPDAIAIISAISIIGKTSAYYNWQLVASGTTTGGTWTSAGTNSCVEYNLGGTSFTGGRILGSGYFGTTTQSRISVDILKDALFSNQLERDGLNGVYYEITLIIAADTNSSNVYGSLDWEEISR